MKKLKVVCGGQVMNMNIETFVQEQKEELEQLLLTLARIPAPSGKEERRAEFCLNWLHVHGAKEAYVDQAGNVVYLYRQAEDGCLAEVAQDDFSLCRNEMEQIPLIVFDAHMDVVFPDETELPLFEEDGKVFCPGVGDDTANLAVLLMTAAYAAKYRPDTGEYGLLFVCSVGEEGLGNLKGVREIEASFGKRIAAFYSFDLHLDAYTSKAVGSLRYRIAVETKGGHSYGDFGNANAIAVLAGLISELYGIKAPERGKTTYNVGMISGGTSVNTIAQRAEMLYEIRSDDYEDLMEMRARFEEMLSGYPIADKEFEEAVNIEEKKTDLETADIESTDLEVVKEENICRGIVLEEDAQGKNCKRIQEEECDRDWPEDIRIFVEEIGERPCEKDVNEEKRKWLFAQTERIFEQVTGKVPQPVPCSTNCNIPLSLGIPAICVGMCDGAGAHTREEYVVKESLVKGMEAALRLLEEVKWIFRKDWMES